MGNTGGLESNKKPNVGTPTLFPTYKNTFSSASLNTLSEITAQNKVKIGYPNINTLNISLV